MRLFERESHIWLFGCWTISWFWKFTQLSAGLSVPSSSEKKICFTAPWERLMCHPPPDSTNAAITNTEVYETPPIKGRSHCSVQYDLFRNRVSGLVTSCRSRELLFNSPTAAYGFPVNLCVGPRSVFEKTYASVHSVRGWIEICTRSAV